MTDTNEQVEDLSADDIANPENGAADETQPPAKQAEKAVAGDTALNVDDEGEGKAPAADWPDDWREKMAGDDEEALKAIKRYGSPAGVAKALREAQALIRSGKVKRDMPDASDEAAMKEWRKAEGIPDDPTGYTIPETVKSIVTDDDKPMLASFTEFAHAKGASQQVVDVATEWYFQAQDQLLTEQAERDAAVRDETVEAIREEYGREYKANMQLAKRFMEITPEIGADWAAARLPDGRRLGDMPEFIKWAVDQGRATFGDVAFATADAETQHNNRKAEIEKIMNEDMDRYEREGLGKEYREILEREARRGNRS